MLLYGSDTRLMPYDADLRSRHAAMPLMSREAHACLSFTPLMSYAVTSHADLILRLTPLSRAALRRFAAMRRRAYGCALVTDAACYAAMPYAFISARWRILIRSRDTTPPPF